LLRQLRADIRTEDWAKPAYREATVKYFKLCRACKEVTRVEVEVRRLQTAIHNEEREVDAAVERLIIVDPHLGLELKRQHRQRRAINMLHIHRLNKIEASVGYGGLKGIGIRWTSDVTPTADSTPHDIQTQVCQSQCNGT